MALFEGTAGFSYYFVLFPCAFSLISVAGMWTCLRYESPVYLWLTNRKEAANRVMKQLANESVGSYTVKRNQDLTENEQSVVSVDKQNTTTELLNNPFVRRILLFTMALSLMQQFTGINDVLIFSVESVSSEIPFKYAKILFSGCAFLFSFMTIFFIDRKPYPGVNRLTLLKVGAVGMFVCNVLILSVWHTVTEISYLSIVFLLFFETSIGPVMWLYISELATPVNMGISTSANWFGVLLIAMISGSNNEDLRRCMYGVYCLDCILVRTRQVFVLAQWFLIETLSVTNQDLEKRFYPREDSQLPVLSAED